MADGYSKGLAATALCDLSDPTRLTWRELNEGWGSAAQFMISYGLKPYDQEDCEEALAISRLALAISVETFQLHKLLLVISNPRLDLMVCVHVFSGL